MKSSVGFGLLVRTFVGMWSDVMISFGVWGVVVKVVFEEGNLFCVFFGVNSLLKIQFEVKIAVWILMSGSLVCVFWNGTFSGMKILINDYCVSK